MKELGVAVHYTDENVTVRGLARTSYCSMGGDSGAPEMHDLLVQTWTEVRDDDGIDVAIVTGSGDAFCAGADLKTYIPPIIRGERRLREIVNIGFGGITRGLHRITKPAIAAVNGSSRGSSPTTS